MPFQDPLYNRTSTALATGSAQNVLSFIRDLALAAGWAVDQYDTTPNIATETGGAELYIHAAVTGMAAPAYFSLKAFGGSSGDQQAIHVWANTGYSSTKRVDNQPGMFAKTAGLAVNAVSRTQVFAGSWDTGANANPADLGMYLTVPWNAGAPLTGPVPIVNSSSIALHTRASSSIDLIDGFFDITASGSSRALAVFWYLDNALFGLVMGHVLFDQEGVAPFNTEGNLLQAWPNIYDNRLATTFPVVDSLAGSRTDSIAGPLEVIRNRTVGAETFPAGTADGSVLLTSGPVVLQQGRIEASDGTTRSLVVRPDQRFGQVHNGLQSPDFPDPRITIHLEPIVGTMTQERRGFMRPRGIARFPNGGALSGSFFTMAGNADWSDCGYCFPLYFAPCRGLAERSIVSEGGRSYVLFPGNRGDPPRSLTGGGRGARGAPVVMLQWNNGTLGVLPNLFAVTQSPTLPPAVVFHSGGPYDVAPSCPWWYDRINCLVASWLETLHVLRVFPRSALGDVQRPETFQYGNILDDILDPLAIFSTYSSGLVLDALAYVGEREGVDLVEGLSPEVEPPNPPLPAVLEPEITASTGIPSGGWLRVDAAIAAELGVSTLALVACWEVSIFVPAGRPIPTTWLPRALVCLRLFGDRARVFAFLPDWGEGIQVAHEWPADIFESDNLFEQRVCALETPGNFPSSDHVRTYRLRYQIHREPKFITSLRRIGHLRAAIGFFPEPFHPAAPSTGLTTIALEDLEHATHVSGEMIRFDLRDRSYETRKVTSVDYGDTTVTVSHPWGLDIPAGAEVLFFLDFVTIDGEVTRALNSDNHATCTVPWRSLP